MTVADTEPRLNVLISFAYAANGSLRAAERHQDITRLVIDSGAFSAYRVGKKVELDDYCRFLETCPTPIWRYFTLDVIGDPEATMRNYETMRSRGFQPIPIFTRGEDPAVLDQLYATSDVVGVGGLVKTRGNKGFVNGIMSHVRGRKVHWLGFGRVEFLRAYRPYMCDSTTWENGGLYGYVVLYMGFGQTMRLDRDAFRGRPDRKVAERLRFLGIDPELLLHEQAWRGGGSLARQLGARSAVALSLDIQKNLGTLMFNAAVNEPAVDMLAAGFRHLTRRS